MLNNLKTAKGTDGKLKHRAKFGAAFDQAKKNNDGKKAIKSTILGLVTKVGMIAGVGLGLATGGLVGAGIALGVSYLTKKGQDTFKGFTFCTFIFWSFFRSRRIYRRNRCN